MLGPMARCSCELTLALLAHFGCPHARKMLQQGTTRVGEWGAEDWLQHMAEEEARFFPLLPQPVRAHLRREHTVVRRMFEHRGPNARVPDSIARGHAELEDQWAEYIARQRGLKLHSH